MAATSPILTPGHFGWAGPDAAKEAWDKIGHLFPQFLITGDGPDDSAGKRFALYEQVRKVVPGDTLNYAQETGDCFVAGTLVSLSDGSTAHIEDIGTDEPVICGTGEAKLVKTAIAKSYKGELLRVAVKGMEPVICTPDHRFKLANGDLMAAGLLQNGQMLRMAADSHVSAFANAPVASIGRSEAQTDVYCLEIATDLAEERTFLANGYVVSNCVSFGAKNAVEYLEAIAILLGESGGPFHSIFPPYLYSTGRVLVGKGQMRGQQGSVGSWQAQAVKLFGSLMSDFAGVPKYSGDIANRWGDVAPTESFLSEGKTHLVQTAAPIGSWEELRRAIKNGYPCTVASNQGFEMEARSDGFHYASGQWGHQMMVPLIDDRARDAYGGLLNSWGNVHGRVKDFVTGELWPIGMLRVRRETLEHMIQSGEVFAYSNWAGFPSRELDWASII